MKPFKHNPLSLKIKIHESGFTLIELAVVIVIVGIIISVMATVLPSLIQSAKIKKAQAILEKLDYSLEGYIVANGRCPCPDTDGDGIENRISGTSPPTDDTCSSYVGDIPYVTLGISSGNDVWGNRLKYGVYDNFIRTTKSGLCSSLSSFITATFDNSKLYTTDQSGNDTHQAYVIVSGGPKDLDNDGSDVFFDGLNEGTDVQFDDPNRIENHITYLYDDLLKATSFTYLYGKDCTGGGGGGGGGNVEICDDPGEEDEDGDGYANCYDQDCYTHPSCFGGPPTDDIQINESPLPNEKVGGSYSQSIQATGGSLPYTWNLVSSDIPGLNIGTLSGNLNGTIDVCAGTYNITVRVVDTESNEDTHTFSITVENDTHVITPEPTGGTDFTCNSTICEYNFQVSGLFLGDHFEWALTWQGSDPGGFQVIRTGERTAQVQKVSNVTAGAGTYSFQLRAWDSDCATNEVVSPCCYRLEITAAGLGGPLTEHLEAQWHLDECDWNGTLGEVKDSGENFLDGTAKNGADTIGSGKMCKTGFFDGTDDFLDMGDIFNGILGSTSNSFTIAAWIYPYSLTDLNTNHFTKNCFIAKASVSHNDNLEVGVNPDGRIHVYLHTQGQDRYDDFGPNSAITLNAWSFVAVTYNSGSVTVTINDTRYENTTRWAGGDTIANAAGSPFTIGSSQHSYIYFNGKIDEVMVFSEPLTEDETQSLYALTHTCSGGCYDGTVAEYRMENFPWSGADEEVVDSGSGGSNGKAALQGSGSLPSQTTPSNGKVCRAGVFTRINATNGGYLDIGDPTDGDLDPGTDPWTVSSWIKWDGSTGENIIFNKENLYETRVNGGYVQYAWRPHWAWDGGTSFPVTADTWAYVTTVYDGTKQILYKDGVQIYSRNQTGAMGSNSSKFLLAARGSGSPYNFFGGMIDEVKIYNRALSENEIMADMGEIRDCATAGVFITTTSLPGGTISSTYSATLAATGGSSPYGWEIIAPNPISGLSIVPSTGELNGTINVCAGDYDITVRVTDAASSMDERTFTLTVVNGTLTVSPAAPQTYNCTASTFSQDFTVSGPRMGSLGNWSIEWLGTNPGGFEVISTGDNTARFRKLGTSVEGNGYQFKLTAEDSSCSDNQVDSGYYLLNISGDGANTPYYASMIAEWRMDECTWVASGDVNDYSGNGHHGTANSAVTIDAGKICRAASTDPSSSYILLNPVVDIGETWSISAWFWWPLSSSGSGWWTLTRGTNDHQILVNRSSNLLGTYDNDGGRGFRNCGFDMSTLNDGWHHLVAVGHNSQTDFYIDTDFKGSADEKSTTDIRTLGNHIGGSQNWGKFDEVMLYARALNQNDIDALYTLTPLCPVTDCYTAPAIRYKMEEGSWGDGSAPYVQDSMGSYDGTAYNGANTVVDGVCRAGSFDSTQSQYINCGTIPISGNTTVSCWINASAQDEVPFHKDNCFTFILRSSGDISYADSSNWSFTNFGNHDIGFTFGTWNHIVVSKTGSTVRIFKNGDLKLTRTFGSAITSNSNNVYIGSYNATSYYYDGLIDEVIMWNRGLSESTIKNMYEAGRCAP